MKKHFKLTDERAYFKPFQYAWAYDVWLEHEQSHWLHSEMQFHDDVSDWKNKTTDEQKYFITNIFRFFTQGDIDVAGGYIERYLPIFKQPEVRMMLLGFAAREAVHIAAYSHLIETLGLPDAIYNEFLEYDVMKQKHEYVLQYSSNGSKESAVAEDIAIFSGFTEGMQLFSSFIMLLNFTRNGLFKNMGQIISWSIVDETYHCENMIRLFKTYVSENKSVWNDDFKSKIYTIAEKMVDLEDKFIELSFGMCSDMMGLTISDVKQYIRFITDRRLITMGLKGIFKIKRNPLPWVEEMINAPTHTNFFENKPTDYSKGAMTGSWGDIWV